MRKAYSKFIDFYQAVLSPDQSIFSPIFSVFFGGGCRFTPYCSEYSRQAVNKYGIIKGGVLTLKRLSRCNMFSKPGPDPVP